tara:strand:- start:30 stop:422 length:393 start_codon:yes stop_codon:yes gene_type:complete
MSTLKADTIQSTGGGAATLTKQHAAKAFNVFEPDVAATIASLNISTLTDNGAGDFSHAFTSSFSAAKQYTVAGSCGNSAAATTAIEYCKPREEAVILASSLRTSTGYVTATGAAMYDYPNSSFACHGDLA